MKAHLFELRFQNVIKKIKKVFMKILHTADWHLGKRLDRFSRLDEQVLVLDEIVQIAEQQKVDVILVAGDLFDNFNPSVEAIELFYKL